VNNFLTCSGAITQDASGPICSGAWESVPASEIAQSGAMLSSSDFSLIASYIVGWFIVAFAVKLIRRIFNT
jgi:hypothetical protein